MKSKKWLLGLLLVSLLGCQTVPELNNQETGNVYYIYSSSHYSGIYTNRYSIPGELSDSFTEQLTTDYPDAFKVFTLDPMDFTEEQNQWYLYENGELKKESLEEYAKTKLYPEITMQPLFTEEELTMHKIGDIKTEVNEEMIQGYVNENTLKMLGYSQTNGPITEDLVVECYMKIPTVADYSLDDKDEYTVEPIKIQIVGIVSDITGFRDIYISNDDMNTLISKYVPLEELDTDIYAIKTYDLNTLAEIEEKYKDYSITTIERWADRSDNFETSTD